MRTITDCLVAFLDDEPTQTWRLVSTGTHAVTSELLDTVAVQKRRVECFIGKEIATTSKHDWKLTYKLLTTDGRALHLTGNSIDADIARWMNEEEITDDNVHDVLEDAVQQGYVEVFDLCTRIFSDFIEHEHTKRYLKVAIETDCVGLLRCEHLVEHIRQQTHPYYFVMLIMEGCRSPELMKHIDNVSPNYAEVCSNKIKRAMDLGRHSLIKVMKISIDGIAQTAAERSTAKIRQLVLDNGGGWEYSILRFDKICRTGNVEAFQLFQKKWNIPLFWPSSETGVTRAERALKCCTEANAVALAKYILSMPEMEVISTETISAAVYCNHTEILGLLLADDRVEISHRDVCRLLRVARDNCNTAIEKILEDYIY